MKITAIKQQVKRANRYSFYVDGEYAFSLSETALLDSGLASGQELDNTRLQELKQLSGVDKAYTNALRFVVMRPRSEWELQQYLRRKGLDEEPAARITERLRRLDLLNDHAFAESWVANRRLLKATSKRKLILELKQKHVPEAVISEVLAEDPADERQVLRELVAKKQARYPDRQKFMRYLAGHGFGFDDIKAVLAHTEDK